MPIGNICNGISFRHDDSVLRSFSGAVPGSGAGADHTAEGRYEEEIESRVLVSTQTYLL